jgi:hypothetical protein
METTPEEKSSDWGSDCGPLLLLLPARLGLRFFDDHAVLRWCALTLGFAGVLTALYVLGKAWFVDHAFNERMFGQALVIFATAAFSIRAWEILA